MKFLVEVNFFMKYFNLHIHKPSNQKAVFELINQYPHEFDSSIITYSIGIHPLFIDEERLENDFQIFEEKLYLKECWAVGECGLDKRSKTSLSIQEDVFEKQLLLAQKFNKPVIIHCVGAFQKLIAIKKRLKITVPIIIHGFSKNAILAQQLIDAGFYLSFGKNFFKNPEMEIVFTSIPIDRFFLETDMTDQKIQDIYALAAKYKEIEIDALQNILKDSFNSVFNNPKE